MFVTNPYYVYINSRDRESGTDENFSYNIKMPISTNGDYTHVVVLNMLIPKSFYLVQYGGLEDLFQLDENGTTVTIQVPSASYLLNAFKTTIGALLTAASPNGLTYTLTYPSLSGPDDGKWTFTQNNGSIVSSLIFNEHLFEPFGFFSGSTNVFNLNGGTQLKSTCVIKLQSEDRLLLHSNICTNPGMDDILVSINSTTSINYSSINYECPAPEFYCHTLSSTSSSSYNFTLTDENNEIIPLNGLNVNITLLLFRKDPIFDQIRNLMKMIVSK